MNPWKGFTKVSIGVSIGVFLSKVSIGVSIGVFFLVSNYKYSSLNTYHCLVGVVLLVNPKISNSKSISWLCVLPCVRVCLMVPSCCLQYPK